MKNRKLTIWSYMIRCWKTNLLLLSVIFLGSAVSTYWGVLSANALTSLVNDGFSGFIHWIRLMCICLLLWVVQIVLSSYLHSLAIQKMNTEIRKDIAIKLSKVDKEHIYEKASSSYVSWMVNDIATINEYGFGNFSMILSQLFNILLGAYVLLTLHYSLILSILLLTVVMIIVPKFFSKKLNSYMSDFSKANENFTHHLNGLFGGLRVLYGTQSMLYFINKVILASENLAKRKIKFSSYSGVMQSATNGVSLASQIILLLQAGWLYSLGYVVIGSLTATQYLSATIFSSLTGLGANWIEMKTIQEIFDKFSELDESEVFDDDFLPVLENGISVKNVSFAYPGSEQSILNNISINIKKGGKYGLVGQSGSGKTTLLNLLFGIFKPSQGEIYYDDISYKELGSTLFKKVAYVEQEGVLFSGSIIENITLGKDYDENTVKTILKAVDLLEWVEQQTNGLMTVIDWEGKMISGGQKQKIALARALFLEKDIIFLDESVSAIDKISAKRIEKYLLNRDDLTLVFITHHLNPEVESKLDGIIRL